MSRLPRPHPAVACPRSRAIRRRARSSPSRQGSRRFPPPCMPGGFDYARKLWFEGIGATGRVTSALIVTGSGIAARASGWSPGWQALRTAMGARIHAAIEEPYASFAEALITGERSTVPPDINRSLQVSGPVPHPVDLGAAHVAGGGGRVLGGAGACWRCRAGLALALADQEMGGSRRNGQRALLHAARQFRRGDGAVLHHGGRGVLRRAGGPAGPVHPQPGHRGADHPAARARSGGRCQLPDVLPGGAGPRRLPRGMVAPRRRPQA